MTAPDHSYSFPPRDDSFHLDQHLSNVLYHNYKTERYVSFLSVAILLMLLINFLMAVNSTDLRAQSYPLFESENILDVTLSVDMRALMKDRGENTSYHQAVIMYKQGETNYEIPLRVKARGNFRKNPSNCRYPPLFLNFKKSVTPKESVFKKQDKTKLVTPCRGDQFVVQEYLVYKLYNLITPNSFRARLVRVIYHDNVREKSTDPYLGILLEEEEQLEKRLDAKLIGNPGYDPRHTVRDAYLQMAVFQFLIGNTDWSIQFQQNIKLLTSDKKTLPITIPYDFDHAGIVRAPYAKPAPELQLATTLQRRYRGYCEQNMDVFNDTFEKFNQLRDEFYAIYENNDLLNDGYKKQTLRFLDDFYETINDPKKAERAFMYPCDPSGTGNVVIKGLNVD